MKIKNFKIYQKAVSRAASLVLVASLLTTALSACSSSTNRNNILKGTILENSCVITFEDGSKDIAIAVESCNSDDNVYHHYYSIISGEYFGDTDCQASQIEYTPAHHYAIAKEENISAYLTNEDIANAVKGQLDDKDIIAIISRTIYTANEETNNLTK